MTTPSPVPSLFQRVNLTFTAAWTVETQALSCVNTVSAMASLQKSVRMTQLHQDTISSSPAVTVVGEASYVVTVDNATLRPKWDNSHVPTP